jgi:hypothetical protein
MKTIFTFTLLLSTVLTQAQTITVRCHIANADDKLSVTLKDYNNESEQTKTYKVSDVVKLKLSTAGDYVIIFRCGDKIKHLYIPATDQNIVATYDLEVDFNKPYNGTLYYDKKDYSLIVKL